MPGTNTMTIRMQEETRKRLDDLAKATERTKAWIAAKAIEEYLDVNEWQVRAISEAVKRADSKNAKFYDHEDVVEIIKKKASSRRRN